MLIEKERECDRQERETNQVRVGNIRMKRVCMLMYVCVCAGGCMCGCGCVGDSVCVWKG